jgi:hypothetical protein
MSSPEKSKKPVVYIAGPISKGNLQKNIAQADEAFVALVKAGFAPINPMWSCYAGAAKDAIYGVKDNIVYNVVGTAFSSLDLTHEDWLGLDLPVVERCDAVLRLPGESTGASREVRHASEHGVPVYYVHQSIEDAVAQMQRKFFLQPEPDHVLGVGIWFDVAPGTVYVGIGYDGAEPWSSVKAGQRVRFREAIGQLRTADAEVLDVWAGLLADVPARFFEGVTSPDHTYPELRARRERVDDVNTRNRAYRFLKCRGVS